eukprot:CAMPEP_0179018458 /NCGR_PEP_ID=MMETSP0796-20121207/4363_1 /TAXON_ID=73915 /ORGANISM="Pyrodinium bahamense, Strain pbaha01" /LENGTH=70 /DNA_ID=CAMNT_0020714215 /DNA_START=21 /DNA_END=230 /DNA_ORIENTATION=+
MIGVIAPCSMAGEDVPPLPCPLCLRMLPSLLLQLACRAALHVHEAGHDKACNLQPHDGRRYEMIDRVECV